MKKPNGLYFVIINWYNETDDENKDTSAFVIAKSIGQAVNKVAKDFQYVNSTYAEEIISPDYSNVSCVYVPDDSNLIQKIKDENNY